jgi:hypothetical protein
MLLRGRRRDDGEEGGAGQMSDEDSNGLLKATYDMVLVMHKEWPDMKASVRLLGGIQDEHARRLSVVETKVDKAAEDTGNHRIVIAEKRAGRWDDLAWKVLAMVLVGLLSAGVVEFIHRTAGH